VTDNEFTVEALPLRVAMQTASAFASSDQTLPMINLVSFKPTDSNEIELAATDRYMISWETIKAVGSPFEFLMPVDAVKRLLSVIPKGTRSKPLTGMVTFTQAEKKITAKLVSDHEEASFTFTPFDGEFVDYRKLINDARNYEVDTSLKSIHLTPYLVSRVFRDLSSRLGLAPVEISFRSKHKPILVTSEDTTFGALIMPVRRRDDREDAA
jgi:DNA polymerase III sliding clamp (beta) subunit (PCNA family)